MIFDEPISPKRAHAMVKQAIRDGQIVKPKDCERCPGGIRVMGHHKDYRKPLDLEFLCDTCHQKRHRPMIIPWCAKCDRAVLHKKKPCFGRPPTNRCGICRKLGHNCGRCPRGEALRRVCPSIRAAWLQRRIVRVNEALVAVRERPLPSAVPARVFVDALEEASHHLTYHAGKPGPTGEKRERARDELSALADLLLRRAGIDPDALEAA